MRFWNWLFGYVELLLTGNELPRFLRLCSNKGLLVWDVCYKEYDEMVLCMGKRDVFLARDALRKTRTHIRVLKRYGFPFYFFRYRKKAVYFVCISAAVLALLFLSGYIWSIDIVGNSYLSEERLHSYLEEHSCGIGASKKSIKPTEVEKMMLKDFPEIIWNSVSIRGTTMHISIKEQILNDEIKGKTKEKQDLISPISGTIHSIYVRNGTAAVSKGDEVKKGQRLVYGWIPIYNDSGTEIQAYQVAESDADVFVKGNVSLKHDIKRKHLSRLYSKDERCYFYFGSLGANTNLIPMIYGKQNATALVSTHQLYLMKTIPLPVFFNSVREKRFTFYHENYSNGELKELQEKYCQDFIEKLEQKGVQIIDKNVMITYGADGSKMEGELECLYPANSYGPSQIPQVIKTRNDDV